MSESDFTLNWGIVTTGLISQDFVTALLSFDEPNHHKVVAVAARHHKDAVEFASRFKVPTAAESYDALFALPEVNIVYIGSLNISHKEQCLAAIAAGKHVLCEKPMSMNTKEQEEVFKAAKAKGVFFMEALWTRFFPVTEKIREELKNKTIGDMHYFSSQFIMPCDDVDRINKKELGGGVVYDLGIYTIQLACLAFDHEKPEKIVAVGHKNKSDVDISASITLLYKGNRTAQLYCSCLDEMCAASYFVGDKGHLVLPEFSWSPDKLILPKKEVFSSPIPAPNKNWPTTNYDHGIGMRYEAEAVRQAIAKGLKEHPYATHDMSRLIMSIIDEVRDQLGCYKEQQ